jgi:cation diffusion facilitator CzcD-associated flavoprotein CzcO
MLELADSSAEDPGALRHQVVIIGSGFSGIAMAVALKRDGMDDFVILERAGDLGGTWRDNTYPGCACDVPSILYSLTDEQNPRWSRLFAPAPEIWAYLRAVAERHGVTAHMRYGEEVRGASWNEDDQRWLIETPAGVHEAEVLITGVGALCDPSIPALPGLQRFTGHSFHSARWDHDHDLTGRRVGVIGTGASAIQFVPKIQPRVQALRVFQRTPQWIMPRGEVPISPQWQDRFERRPWLLHAARGTIFSLLELRHRGFSHPQGRMATLNERMAVRHIERQVTDPALRAKVTPTYRMGCKRILGSNTWYPAIGAANAQVVTDGIAEVVADGIVDGAGTHHELDTLIFATGFHVVDSPMWSLVRGRGGRSLAESFQGSPKAYLGTAFAGFPNLFSLLGPGTGLGHNTVLSMIETQVGYIRQALAFRRRQGLAAIVPRQEAQDAYVAELDAAMQGSVWTAGGCQSWYLDETGRNSTLWPQTVRAYQRRVSRFVPSDNELVLPHPARTPVAA